MPDETLRSGHASQGRQGLLHRSPNDRPQRNEGLEPIPEVRTMATEFLVQKSVALFEIANDGISVLRRQEEVEQEFGVEWWSRARISGLRKWKDLFAKAESEKVNQAAAKSYDRYFSDTSIASFESV